jgi:hypothetical protein
MPPMPTETPPVAAAPPIAHPAPPASEPQPFTDPLRARFEVAARSLNEAQPDGNENATAAPSHEQSAPAWCHVCGGGLVPGARFCQHCGTAVAPLAS